MTGLYEPAVLSDALRDARARTWALYGHVDLEAPVPCIATLNPPLWELGHIGWFQEFWCLRGARTQDLAGLPESRLRGADSLFDSSRIAHDSRWRLPYPSRREVEAYMAQVLDETAGSVARASDEALYFLRLALVHEDMHGEALLMTLQQLGFAAPDVGYPTLPRGGAGDDVALEGGPFMLGSSVDGAGFPFDNERDAHEVRVAPFAISSRPVSQEEFAAFVDDDGYERPELWSEAGRSWLHAAGRRLPLYWTREGDAFQVRRFDSTRAIDARAAMVHVNQHEAQAWCRWAGRRLPTEAEWEFAARHAVGRLDAMLGGVWEWTSSAFVPYPGFVAGPYRDYSQPWFHDHAVLRGGSFATRSRIATPTYRNFYQPHRADPFAGFRTCAVEGA